jgi:hypothetical protein
LAFAQILPISAALRRQTSANEHSGGTMKSPRATPEQRRDRADLDPRFGKIGISAVAAAMRYQSEIKNPAYAPAKQPTPVEVDEEAAA